MPPFIPKLGPPRPAPREQILTEWRGINLAPLEKAQTDKTQSVSALIPGVLASLKLEQRMSDREIIMAWNSLMDPNVVTHARPTLLTKEGTLMVTVDSNAWLYEIVRWRRREILDRLHSAFGPEKIKKISFRVE